MARGGDKRRQKLVEAVTVPKIPATGSRRSGGYHMRLRPKVTVRFFPFTFSARKHKEVCALLANSLLLNQGKEQRIDNSIKFMFIERAPRGSQQPIAERI